MISCDSYNTSLIDFTILARCPKSRGKVNISYIQKLVDAVNVFCQKNLSKIEQYRVELELITKTMARKEIGYIVSKLLLSQKPNLELMDSERLIQASCHLGKIYPNKEVAFVHYKNAVSLAAHSVELQATPLYQLAYKKTQELKDQNVGVSTLATFQRK